MNATETARLCRIITSLNPAQKFDEETPAVWHAVLARVPLADALEAVKVIAQRTPWIGTADICSEVGRIRKARLQASSAADELVPNVDPDDPAAFKAERRAIMTAAANGSLDRDAYSASGITLSGAPARRAIGAAEPGSAEKVRQAIRAAAESRVEHS